VTAEACRHHGCDCRRRGACVWGDPSCQTAVGTYGAEREGRWAGRPAVVEGRSILAGHFPPVLLAAWVGQWGGRGPALLKDLVLVGVTPVVKTRPASPTPSGGAASQAVSEYSPRKETPKSTHARRRPGGDAPSDKHELCDRKLTFPRRRRRGDTHASPSYPVRSPQTLRIRHSDTLKGPSENPPLRAHGASLSGGRPKLRTPP